MGFHVILTKIAVTVSGNTKMMFTYFGHIIAQKNKKTNVLITLHFEIYNEAGIYELVWRKRTTGQR